MAHSLGGFVVANGLIGRYGKDTQDQEIVNHTCGAIFLGTPFKESNKASWADIVKRSLEVFGNSNDQTIEDLDKRSEKLQKISTDFHIHLKERLESEHLEAIQVACFFEEIKTSRSFGTDISLGHVVTADSATLAGCSQVGINATHQMMCSFSNAEVTGYKLVTGKIQEMIDNFEKNNKQLKVDDASTNQSEYKLTFTPGRRKNGPQI